MVKTNILFHTCFLCLVVSLPASGQAQDLLAIYRGQEEQVTHLLFSKDGPGFAMKEAFLAREADLNEGYPALTLSADFNGDGVDEIAFFEDMHYTPNMVPGYTRSVIRIDRSRGTHFLPSGNWFSVPDSLLNFQHVDFSVAGDYDQDGYGDIALFHNDPGSDILTVYVLKSEASGFSGPLEWYSCDRNEFNFTALKYACAGDFNGNGKPDIAVFYNYFGTAPDTRQSVFLFESEGSSFTLLPRAYDATKASLDFDHTQYALSGDYDLDGISDLAVLHEDPADQDLIITVFGGSENGQFSATGYKTFVDREPSLSQILHAAGADFTGHAATDLAFFYDEPQTGSQEILVLENTGGSFTDPETAFTLETGDFSMADITSVQSGRFSFPAPVSAATWKDDRKGALSITFDDGYRGAFEHGGEEMEAADLKATFYIITDTSAVYDGELASTTLVREYKDKGHEIASHTRNHANLGLLTESGDLDSLDRLLSSSLTILNERFEQYTMSMSIPYGSFLQETLEYISRYFYSSRSSQHGFNLATPQDFFAMKSWPVLSTTSPAFVDMLLSLAESYGTYLPLMYHDMVDEPFDEETLIYTYHRDLFRQTLQAALERDLWIDTNERIYKYIRERNALLITYLEMEEMDQEGGSFSFSADDGLPDSIFNVALTLKIALPGSWTGDTVSVGPEGSYSYLEVLQDSTERFILYDFLPAGDASIHVQDGIRPATGIHDPGKTLAPVSLAAFPNPFHQETFIQVSNVEYVNLSLIIRDIHGKIIHEINDIPDGPIRLSRASLPPGIYILQLIKAGESLAATKLLAL
jgi:peptidoglycan/xylan/chitin deacetylase (PgdA/CDA1 family)